MFLTVLLYLQKSLPKRFPSAVGPPKVLRHGSKMTPGASQDAPKRVPRAAKTGPRAAKIAPRDSKIGPRGHSGPSRVPKNSPRGLQEVTQKSQEPSKTSARGFWVSVLHSFPTVFQERIGLARDVYVQRAFQIQTSRLICWLQNSWEVHRGITREWQLLGSTSFPCGLPHWPGGGCGRSPLDTIIPSY